MSHPRVIVPRVRVSIEGTRELFGLSANDAATVTRLAERAFEQSAGSAPSPPERARRHAAAKRVRTAPKARNARIAARRK